MTSRSGKLRAQIESDLDEAIELLLIKNQAKYVNPSKGIRLLRELKKFVLERSYWPPTPVVYNFASVGLCTVSQYRGATQPCCKRFLDTMYLPEVVDRWILKLQDIRRKSSRTRRRSKRRQNRSFAGVIA